MGKKNADHPIDTWLSRPIIPVLSHVSGHETVLSHARLIFLQGGELADLPVALEALSRGELATIPVMLHIDLLAGLASDEAGLRFIAGFKRISGIITVRSHIIAPAHRLGLACILRLFLQDGRAVERGLHIIEQSTPDLVELIPGVAAIEMASKFAAVPIPRIAGGLVRTADLVHRILASGCRAVSTSNTALWKKFP